MPDSQELAELRKEPEPAPSTEEENLRNLREKLARESPEDARVYRMVAHRRGIPVGDESAPNRAIALEDFWAYLPQHAYIYVPTLEIWPAASVNAKLPPVTIGSEMQDDGTAKTRNVKPATWLDIHRSVEQMVWIPGEPRIIENRLVNSGGWVDRAGSKILNLYTPPTFPRGDPNKVEPWLELLKWLYPNEAEHIILWLAHTIQRPDEKLNHALVLGGDQGIGKDSLLEPVVYGVGPWNVSEVSPVVLLGRFNPYVKSVLLRVSEAHDLGEMNRFALYERMKTMTTTPPEVLRCDEKHIREHHVFNRMHIVITTNHKNGGIYLPKGDRRHFVAWSDRAEGSRSANYFIGLFTWYAEEGIGAVIAYLQDIDLAAFNPKAPPPKTAAWWEIVESNRAPEHAYLEDVLQRLGYPPAVTVPMIVAHLRADETEFRDFLRDRKNARLIPHRFEEVGYVRTRNEDQTDGRWKVGGYNVVVYCLAELPLRDRIAAAQELR